MSAWLLWATSAGACANVKWTPAVVLMCQWFAPTKLIVSFERDGIGKFSDEDLERYVLKNTKGEVVGLDFPTKFVLIANHQVCNCRMA